MMFLRNLNKISTKFFFFWNSYEKFSLFLFFSKLILSRSECLFIVVYKHLSIVIIKIVYKIKLNKSILLLDYFYNFLFYALSNLFKSYKMLIMCNILKCSICIFLSLLNSSHHLIYSIKKLLFKLKFIKMSIKMITCSFLCKLEYLFVD